MLGRIEPTGVRPRFAERIADHGIQLPMSLFQVPHEMLGEIR